MSKVHKFVITNPDMCIACNACMKTCVKHAYMRGKLSKKMLDVLTLESGKMPNQCRQCDDAPCANVCPTGSLHIANSCVELCEEICIGCKLCTIACPYGAINIDAEFPPSIQEEVERNLEAGCISGKEIVETTLGPANMDEVVELVNMGYPVHVLSMNEKSKKIEKDIVVAGQMTGHKTTVTIEFTDGTKVTLTEDHIVYTTNGQKPAGDLTADDEIIGVETGDESI